MTTFTCEIHLMLLFSEREISRTVCQDNLHSPYIHAVMSFCKIRLISALSLQLWTSFLSAVCVCMVVAWTVVCEGLWMFIYD